MDVGITGEGGIDMLPALAVGLSALYSAGRAYDNYRYWNDYYKNTGYRPKYPFRSGSMDWMGYASDTMLTYHFARLKRF